MDTSLLGVMVPSVFPVIRTDQGTAAAEGVSTVRSPRRIAGFAGGRGLNRKETQVRTVWSVILVACLLAALVPSAHTQVQKLPLVRVEVKGPKDAAFVADRFDETHVHDRGFVHVVLWPGDAAALDRWGYRYEVVIEDLIARDRTVRLRASKSAGMIKLPGPDRAEYRILGDYVSEMQDLANKHPAQVKLLELSQPTHEGRTIYGLEIADKVAKPDGRPTFYVDGVHHAREWPAGEYPMIFAHYLLEGFGRNSSVTKLMKRGRVIVVPVVNVDGFDFSRSSPLGSQPSADGLHGAACAGLHCEAYWRKNRRSYSGQTLPALQKNPDAYGVDPNRNYSYRWGGAGSSNSTLLIGDQTYRGPAPQSEPETKNVEDLLLSRNVTSIISNHTYSRLVLRPWGDRQGDAPDEAYLKPLGARMAKAMGGYKNIKGIELYITTGTMSEWGYGTLGIPSYTFEHGTSFHPPYSGCTQNCVESDWRGVMKAFVLGGEAALDRRAHGIVSGRVVDRQGSPVAAELTVRRKIKNPLSPGNPVGDTHFTVALETSMEARGSFEWHLPPSTPPHLAAEGKRELYELTISVKGSKKRTLEFVLRRGDEMKLGTIRM